MMQPITYQSGKKLLLIGFILVSGIYWGYTCLTLFKSSLPDFQVYYQTAELSRRQISPQFGLGNFLYPPAAALLLTPMSVFPQQTASIIWTCLALISLVGIIALCLKLTSHFSWLNFFSLFALQVWFFPVKFALGMGQINLQICFLIILAFYFLKQNEWLSGVILGTAAALKLGPIILIGYFIKKGQWQALVSTLITFCALNLLAGIWFGFNSLTDYFTALKQIPTWGNISYYNQSLLGWLARNSVPQTITFLIYGLTFIWFWSQCWFLTQKSPANHQRSFGEWCLWLGAMLSTSGLVWQHHLVFLIPLMVYLIFSTQKFLAPKMILLVCWVLLASNIRSSEIQTTQAFSWFTTSHGFWGMMMLMFLGGAMLKPNQGDKLFRSTRI
ncbi:MAG: Mannosyltransferase [Parcubacteria group bacterium GW2011_GWF2_44_8]|nr:MAG: Mannosyltransferase [Parcubacteria group bacterium GW2011_GWF2_44_8]